MYYTNLLRSPIDIAMSRVIRLPPCIPLPPTETPTSAPKSH